VSLGPTGWWAGGHSLEASTRHGECSCAIELAKHSGSSRESARPGHRPPGKRPTTKQATSLSACATVRDCTSHPKLQPIGENSSFIIEIFNMHFFVKEKSSIPIFCKEKNLLFQNFSKQFYTLYLFSLVVYVIA
jgi:hypothetical protein